MEHVESHVLHHTISVLSTLGPTRSGRLGNIVLEVWYVNQVFNKDGPVENEEGEEGEGEEEEEEFDEDDPTDRKERGWERLDTILSKLAQASISMRERRLTFTLVFMKQRGNERLLSTVRKWLPKLLPRFNELGLLHVHSTRSGRCQAVLTAVASATTNRAAWQRTSRIAVRVSAVASLRCARTTFLIVSLTVAFGICYTHVLRCCTHDLHRINTHSPRASEAGSVGG